MTGEEFSRRVTEMTQTLYRVCRMQLAQRCDYEDAVQESLEKAWENRGRLRDERYMKTWLIRILLNECHNIQRQRRSECFTDATADPRPPPEPEGDMALHDALMRLDEKFRLPILLYYIENYRVAEIAGMLRIPQGTVKTRMAHARQLLKDVCKQGELHL